MSANRVGILGGGQLALMLLDAAVRMGLKPVVWIENSESPVGRIYPHVVQGDLRDEEKLKAFFDQVDTLIFENEFVDCPLLEKVSQGKVKFFPALSVIANFQNKLEQKKTLELLEIPTAEYRVLVLDKNLESQLSEVLKDFGGSCILKWAKFGYDGKGVFSMGSSIEDFRKAKAFCFEASQKSSPVYAERKIDFKRELALIASHSIHGEFSVYPLVVSEQLKGVCVRVQGPATGLGVSQGLEMLAQNYAYQLSKRTGLTGTFAIEFFETEMGKLIVNEIAPRVHNTGHYTLDACSTSQFENHWRAILGMPLGKIACSPGFAMRNILGPEFVSNQGLLPHPGPRSHLHWYHKSEFRPGRKLGHINGSVQSVEEVGDLLNELEEANQKWINELNLYKAGAQK